VLTRSVLDATGRSTDEPASPSPRRYNIQDRPSETDGRYFYYGVRTTAASGPNHPQCVQVMTHCWSRAYLNVLQRPPPPPNPPLNAHLHSLSWILMRPSIGAYWYSVAKTQSKEEIDFSPQDHRTMQSSTPVVDTPTEWVAKGV
jgi:hypothetical protein